MTKYERLWDNCATFGVMQRKPELVKFMEFADQRGFTNFLEIGICRGATFYCWASLAAELGLKIGVDSPNIGDYGDRAPKSPLQLAALHATLTTYKPNSHIFFGNSHVDYVQQWVKDTLDDEQLDFLFIDGDHSYIGAKHDYDAYSPLVKTGGMIALHDIVDSPWHRQQNCHVYRLWQELKGEKYEFVEQDGYPESNGDEWAGIGCIIKP